MKFLNLIIILLLSISAFSQNRAGDCLCYEGDVLEKGSIELIELSPAMTITKVIPAVIETKIISVLVQPATTAADPECPTCVIEIEPIFENVEVQVLIEPEIILQETIPAQYAEVETTTIKYPGRYVTKSGFECGVSNDKERVIIDGQNLSIKRKDN